MKKLPLHNLDALIIDDETDICYLLGSVLKNRHIQSKYVNTLKEAANILELSDPEVIFLDNHLPDGLGMNFIEYIKLHYPSAKIIMITAHDTDADRKKALQEGADYFIGKPFTRDIVYKAVDQVIN